MQSVNDVLLREANIIMTHYYCCLLKASHHTRYSLHAESALRAVLLLQYGGGDHARVAVVYRYEAVKINVA